VVQAFTMAERSTFVGLRGDRLLTPQAADLPEALSSTGRDGVTASAVLGAGISSPPSPLSG
jgi:hypothetical protein